jgi:hypothetical protein
MVFRKFSFLPFSNSLKYSALVELRVALSRIRHLPMFQSLLLGLFADFLLDISLSCRYFIPVVNVLHSVAFLDIGNDLVTFMMRQIKTLDVTEEDATTILEETIDVSRMRKLIERIPSALLAFIRLYYIWMRVSSLSLSSQDPMWKSVLLQKEYRSPSHILEMSLFLLEACGSEQAIFHQELDDIRQIPDPFLRSVTICSYYPSLDAKEYVEYWRSVTIVKSLKDPFEKDGFILISLIASAPSWRLSASYFKYSCIYISDRLVEWKQLYGLALIHKFVQCLVAEICSSGDYLAAVPLISSFLQRPISWYDAASTQFQVKHFLTSYMPTMAAEDLPALQEIDLISRLLHEYIKKSKL